MENLLNDLNLSLELVLLIAPLFLIQYGLAIYCVIRILKEDVENLSRGWWIAIVLTLSLFGSIAYLTIGRKKDR